MNLAQHRLLTTAYGRKVKAMRKTMSGGVDGHAAKSGITRGGDASHKTVMFWSAATQPKGYKAPLAGVESGPLTLHARLGIGGTFILGALFWLAVFA